MKEFLKEYLHYTRQERNGLVVLTLLCVALVVAPAIYRQFFKKSGSTDFSAFQKEIESFYENTSRENTSKAQAQLFHFNPNTASADDFQQLGLPEKMAQRIVNYRNKGGKFFKKEDFKKIYGISEADYERLENYIVLDDTGQPYENAGGVEASENKMVFELFEFDPNTVSEGELDRLGLSPKAIKTMLNFRAKGGTFRNREDFRKIYGISEEDFERLFPYIKIAEATASKILVSNEPKAYPNTYENKTSATIEINSATPAEWQQLRGIGAYYSDKICNFRDKLGGFVSIDQVAETRGLPDSTFQKIKPFLLLSQPVKKININMASAKEFVAHPYLEWPQANAIVKYREQHGSFTSADQLENIKALDKETLGKIRPYLVVE